MNKVTKIASIVVGILIFAVIVYVGFRILMSKAADVQPASVAISDITTNAVKITWTTDQPSVGAVKYGTSETTLNFYAPEVVKDPTTGHTVELTLLSPDSTYYFKIQIGDKLYDNGGVSWTFRTKGTTATAPTAIPTTASTATGTTPTPVQVVNIPNSSNTTCSYTDCASIKTKLGQGCSTADYFKCLARVTPTATASATPTTRP
jgi:hypothetical protein